MTVVAWLDGPEQLGRYEIAFWLQAIHSIRIDGEFQHPTRWRSVHQTLVRLLHKRRQCRQGDK